MTISSDTMDEKTFRDLAHGAIEKMRAAFDALDPDVVEAVMEAGVLKLTFPAGLPFVINLQPPTREIWLAADRHAWHFRYDGARWIDKKGTGAELYSTLKDAVAKKIGASVAL